MQTMRQACTLCANWHSYTPRQSNVVKDDSPKINKPLYQSPNGIKLIFIISAQSFVLLYAYSVLFILWSDLRLCAYLPEQSTSEVQELSIQLKSHL